MGQVTALEQEKAKASNNQIYFSMGDYSETRLTIALSDFAVGIIII